MYVGSMIVLGICVHER